jgi:hypothetical protein
MLNTISTHRISPCKQERKELLSFSRKNPALGIFPKATMNAKAAINKNKIK